MVVISSRLQMSLPIETHNYSVTKPCHGQCLPWLKAEAEARKGYTIPAVHKWKQLILDDINTSGLWKRKAKTHTSKKCMCMVLASVFD
jgi:hypothetical protein